MSRKKLIACIFSLISSTKYSFFAFSFLFPCVYHFFFSTFAAQKVCTAGSDSVKKRRHIEKRKLKDG